MSDVPQATDQAAEQRRRVRRSAIVFGLVAISFYALFIVYAVTHGHR